MKDIEIEYIPLSQCGDETEILLKHAYNARIGSEF